jgi:hypothetical protein
MIGVKPIAVSSVSKMGIDELWERLREAGAPAPTEENAPETSLEAVTASETLPESAE